MSCDLTGIKAFLGARFHLLHMSEAEIIARYDGRAPRYTSYPTAPHFSAATGAQTYAKWLGELDRNTPLSLYLHVPFCDRLCYYCGCNTSVVRLESSLRNYAALLEREIALTAAFIGNRARVSHIHWGGGTPTSLPGDRLVSIMNLLRRLFDFDSRAEVAIEIDPTSLSSSHLDALREMGVTRMSLGVQDLDENVQNAIGRKQSYAVTEECAIAARSLGIQSLVREIAELPGNIDRKIDEAFGRLAQHNVRTRRLCEHGRTSGGHRCDACSTDCHHVTAGKAHC